jgi:hypothetical protein
MNFITKINFAADLDKMIKDLDNTVSQIGWLEKMFEDQGRAYHANQIGLTYRKGSQHPWVDASGSLYDKELKHFVGKETDFTEWNSVGPYTKFVIEQLGKQIGIQFGRIRYMRLRPKTGLSVHADFEPRYHFVLKTNPNSYFLDCTPDNELNAKAYHIPADGFFYKVDTLRNHSVFNGGWEDRIHLVITEACTT